LRFERSHRPACLKAVAAQLFEGTCICQAFTRLGIRTGAQAQIGVGA
jgi:hypothetical protein